MVEWLVSKDVAIWMETTKMLTNRNAFLTALASKQASARLYPDERCEEVIGCSDVIEPMMHRLVSC